MDGSSKAGLESTSTWVGWFFFFSVQVVTVATINVLREVLRDGCHLLRVQKALVFHAGEKQCAVHDLVGKGAFGQGAEVQVGIQHAYISFAERFLRSERLPGRPHTGSSVWVRPPVWYFCGSFYGSIIVWKYLKLHIQFSRFVGSGFRSLSGTVRFRDMIVSYFRRKVYGLVVQVTHPLSPSSGTQQTKKRS